MRGLRPAEPSADDSAFADACADAVREVHPAALAEFEGLLDGSGLSAAALRSTYFGRTGRAVGGCTNVAVAAGATARGKAIVGRNYDWDYADAVWCEARVVAPHRRACPGRLHAPLERPVRRDERRWCLGMYRVAPAACGAPTGPAMASGRRPGHEHVRQRPRGRGDGLADPPRARHELRVRRCGGSRGRSGGFVRGGSA